MLTCMLKINIKSNEKKPLNEWHIYKHLEKRNHMEQETDLCQVLHIFPLLSALIPMDLFFLRQIRLKTHLSGICLLFYVQNYKDMTYSPCFGHSSMIKYDGLHSYVLTQSWLIMVCL